ncbi:MAG TPA: hypothetical protein VJS89_03375 [Gammaproteobacteria bacterium]|nr:hypothetical protein [Gammaproteobacteria bacterium]
MLKKFNCLVILLGCGLIVAACASDAHKNGPGWSYVQFTDPVCGQITLEILDAFHISHKQNTIPFEVWNRWRCLRNTSDYGRITLVVLHEPKPYRLTLRFGKNLQVNQATTDPKIWQEVIGGMAKYARFDSLTDTAHNLLAKDGSITFGFTVKP